MTTGAKFPDISPSHFSDSAAHLHVVTHFKLPQNVQKRLNKQKHSFKTAIKSRKSVTNTDVAPNLKQATDSFLGQDFPRHFPDFPVTFGQFPGTSRFAEKWSTCIYTDLVWDDGRLAGIEAHEHGNERTGAEIVYSRLLSAAASLLPPGQQLDATDHTRRSCDSDDSPPH